MSDATIDDATFRHTDLEACITGRFVRMVFPAQEAATDASVTIAMAHGGWGASSGKTSSRSIIHAHNDRPA